MLNHDKQINIFLEQLVTYSVKDIVISPGSRSTPLVNNILKNKHLFNVHLVLDERSAGYFALGRSKISNKATVLICTSGTATLNYSPAIAESFYSKVPLIVITSDRPMHYRDTGSNQTLIQSDIYKNNINWFYDVPITDKTNFISNVAYKSVYLSENAPQGPVHINWQFEEPFTDKDFIKIKSNVRKKITDNKKIILGPEKLKLFLDMVVNKKGVIIVGSHKFENSEILELAKIVNWPIVADPLSNLRKSDYYENNTIIDTGDMIFREEDKRINSETIIHIGSLPVSKYISKNMEKANNHIFIEDSERIAHEFFEIDLHLLGLDIILNELKNQNNLFLNNHEKRNRYFKNLNNKARESINKNFSQIDEITYKKSIINNLPKNSIYISGNSLPIRILDIILNKCDDIRFIGNRGLSGIDGNISIASGISSITDNHVFLDLGDLAFIHDLGGLITAKRNAKNLTIIVNNNGGGQIFNLLPQSKDLVDFYDEWFITPHENINLSELSNSLKIGYFNPTKESELKGIINKEIKNNINIIEMNFKNTDYHNYNSHIKKVIENINFDE